jgi:hypothetical protein
MHPELKAIFTEIDTLLTQQNKAIQHQNFFRANASNNSQYAACSNYLATHHHCVKAMGALNELSWLCQNGTITYSELSDIQTIANLVKLYLSPASRDDDRSNQNERYARELLLQIQALRNNIEHNNPYLKVKAIPYFAWELLGIAASLVVMSMGVSLLAGVATLGLSLLPTIAVGIGFTVMGYIIGITSVDNAATYGSLVFDSQLKALDDFATALKKQHHMALEKVKEVEEVPVNFVSTPLSSVSQ